MALYNTRYGLPQSMIDYLNQSLPDISGIFTLPQASGITTTSEEVTPTITGLTEEQLALLYPQQDRGGDQLMGGGIFGNLDMSRPKEFNIDGKIVIGYPNLKTGLYQDLQGKNIQNLGLRNLPGITGIFDKLFGEGKPPTYPGLFDKVSPSALIKNPGLFKSFFDRQDVKKQQAIQDKIDAANRATETSTIARAKKAAPDVYRDAGDKGTLGGGGGFSTSGGGSYGGFQSASSSPSGRGRQDW